MTLTSAALMVSIAASGLFAGLMLTLVVILERMWRAMSVTGYIHAMQSFLPVAKGNQGPPADKMCCRLTIVCKEIIWKGVGVGLLHRDCNANLQLYHNDAAMPFRYFLNSLPTSLCLTP